MKKKLALLLALAMLFALAMTACGGKDTGNTDPTPGTNSPAPGNQGGNDDAQGGDNQGGDDNTPAANLPEPGPEVSGDPIKIGHIVDKTGVESLTGQEAAAAMVFAKEYFEKYLGGIDGRPIEVIDADSQSDAGVAREMAQKLVEQDGVVAVFGPTQIGHKTTVMGYMKEAGVPLILYNPTPSGMVKANEYAISVGGGTDQFPTVMADYIFNKLGWRTINTLTMNNAGGHSYIDSLIANFTAMGGTVATEQYYEVSGGEMTTYFANMDTDADGLVAWASGSKAIELWQTWYEMGYNEDLPIVASMHGGFTDYYIVEEIAKSYPDIAKAMVGTYAPLMYTYSLDTEENNIFVETWKAEHNGEVPPGTNLPGACFQALLTLKQAVENNNGSTDPETLYQALQETDVTGPEGHQNFSEGRVATKEIHVCQLVQLDDGTYNYQVVDIYNDVPPTGLTVSAE